eukprot:TRINITY_DN4089_c0_g2_i1.p1 TRINITY_DN4089_c0_g2~~TRINITY_DN4089_c0_g2_i1.p1  ORF type:complete len:342 (-),score=88.49 TRINITY_DN4089_c0_g2_i1:17-1042(-)
MEKMFQQRTPRAKKVNAQEFLPWVEKYRPKSMDDVSHQEEVVATLRKSIESQNLPHLLFYGPPGTGKTSTILAIGRQLFGDSFKERVLELNASDDRGIEVVRTKIKTFAQVATSSRDEKLPPYKLLILDEADSMTTDAQAALRRTMETYSKTTRFCLICNYISRIIEPLASRCAKFRFKPLSSDSMSSRIRQICKAEKINFTQPLVDALGEVSEGDMRKAISILQSAHSLYGSDTNADGIIEISGRVPKSAVEGLIKAATSNQFDRLQSAVTGIIASGYPAAQIFSQLFDVVVTSQDLNNIQKSNIVECIANAEKCLQDGADEFLQLMYVFSIYMKETCGI